MEPGAFRGTDGTDGTDCTDGTDGTDGNALSGGERRLHACAYGDGPDGSGNAETWIRVGHTQHMNFVVHQLSGAEWGRIS
ncbi:hypothetical protein ACH4U7_26225 [Streptomyces sp. NPDC020845]|uniref:hypothetical protein n=1 Tax=Streptomyces sp. NPDC020845 TaxID=3365096 RepID=UPI0037A99A74